MSFLTEHGQDRVTIPRWFASSWAHCMVRVRYACSFDPRRTHSRSKRDHWSFFAVHKGRLRLRAFAYDIVVAPGQMAILPPYRQANFGPAEGSSQVVATEVGFDVIPQLKGANPLMRLRLPVPIAGAGWSEMQQYCARLEAHPPRHPRHPSSLLWAPHWLGLLLATYLEQGFAQSRFTPIRVGPVPQWVEALETMISTASATRNPRKLYLLSGFSRAHVDATFRKHFGTTPRQLWHRCRIELAMEWLSSHPEMSVGEIAEACGYSTQSLFNRHFRRLTGQTPGQFRRQHVG